jgi:hypothetical protein
MSLSVNVIALSQVRTVDELEACDSQVNPYLFPSSSGADDELRYSGSVLKKFHQMAIVRWPTAVELKTDENWDRTHFADHSDLRTAAILQVIAARAFVMIAALQSRLRTFSHNLEGLQLRAANASHPARTGTASTSPELRGHPGRTDIDREVDFLRPLAERGSSEDLQRAAERSFAIFLSLHSQVDAVSRELDVVRAASKLGATTTVRALLSAQQHRSPPLTGSFRSGSFESGDPQAPGSMESVASATLHVGIP